MANPAPFPPTAYDLPDWTRAVTLVVPSGGGSSPPTVAGGAVAIANNFQSYEDFSSTSGHAIGVGPSDGNQHSLVSASIWVVLTAGTITGQAIVQSALTTHTGSIGIINAQVLQASIPSAGAFPADRERISWAGGLVIPKAASTVSQLTVTTTFAGYGGGSITGGAFLVTVELAWT